MTKTVFHSNEHKLAFWRLIAWGLVVFSSSGLMAQDAPQGAPSIDPNLPAGTQVIIRAVQQSNPTTPVELSRSLETMLNLDSIPQARYYLDRIVQLKLNEQQHFELYEQIGGALFLELQTNPDLGIVGQEFAKEVIVSASRLAVAPARISQWVKRLSDLDLSARNLALRTLRNLGPAATAEILHVFIDSNRAGEYPYLRNALKLMGPDAVSPLLAGARANHAAVQEESIRALSHYRSTEAMDVMMRTYLDARLPEALRRVALDTLMRANQLPPDPKVVQDRFYQRANDYLSGRGPAERDLMLEIDFWRWDRTDQRLVFQKIPVSTANRLIATQIAADLYQIDASNPRNRRLKLLTQLESSKRVAGPLKRIEVQPFVDEFEDLAADEVEAILLESLDRNLYPAAIACCEILRELGTVELLAGNAGQPCPLVQAIKSGDRHLQFAAFEAIQQFDSKQAYPGSSLVLSLGIFLAMTEGQGAVVVGDFRPEIAQSLAAKIGASGLRADAAMTGRDLFRFTIEHADVEMLFISDGLSSPDFVELIQQLRNDMRTRRLPIGVLTDKQDFSVALDRLRMQDPLLQIFPMTLDADLIVGQVRRLQQLETPWPVVGIERKVHSISAVQWLGHIASDRQVYRFYDLTSHQQDLAKILYLPDSAEQASQILKSLGTPDAQRELLNFVGQSTYPLEDRKTVARAFAETIKDRGTMLTRAEIMAQYDRYNASELESVEIQELLGMVLDALESNIDL